MSLHEDEGNIGRYIEEVKRNKKPEQDVFFNFIEEEDEQNGRYILYIQPLREKNGKREALKRPELISVFSNEQARLDSKNAITKKYLENFTKPEKPL
ncbi:hypothetical protein [Carnobacterium sp. FSL W8-0810]|uniref:hypothetical protein n=1 Tax=Carnobacterium sp. FSL W8-0810 TaxID=2954705 RepID=UPI0030FAA531